MIDLFRETREMFRSRLSHLLSVFVGLFALIGLFFVQPQPASAYFGTIADYDELVIAINNANASGGGVIVIDPTLPFAPDIDVEAQFPTITTDITILGGGANIHGGNTLGMLDPFYRAFHIAPQGSLTLADFYVEGFATNGGNGGVIFNEGQLNLINTAFIGNFGDLTRELYGGIIHNTGTANIRNAIFGGLLIAQSMVLTDNGYEALGVTIYNTGTMVIENSMISLAIAPVTHPDSSAALYNTNTLTLNNVSLTTNFVAQVDLSDIDNPDFDDIFTNPTIGGLHGTSTSQNTINNSLIVFNFVKNCQFDAGASVSVNSSYTIDLKTIASLDPTADPNSFPDTACEYLTEIPVALSDPNDPTDIILLALLAGFPIPPSITIDGTASGAMPYDLIGAPVWNGVRDAGALEYTPDINGDPITNVDYPMVYFTQPATTVTEDDGTAQIEIAIEFCGLCGADLEFGGIFDIYILDEQTGTATATSDYLALPHFNTATVTVDCTSGCPATVNLPISVVHDLIAEGDETLNLKIIGTSGYGWIDPVEQLEFELTIQDGVPYTASVSATQPDADIDPLTNGQFTFDLGFVASTDITLTYAVSGTANPDEGYTALSGSIIVPAGSQIATLDVIPLGDSSLPADQTVIVTLSGSSYPGHPVDPTPATVTINRPPPTPTTDYPQVIDVIDENGVSLDGVTYTVNLDQLTIQFNIDVFDDGTGADPDSASNPANYILVSEGSVSGFQTASCLAGVSNDDATITFNSLTYNSANYVTTITFDPALADGNYRLIICGTTSIVSATDTTRHLNNGVDVVVGFMIDTTTPTITPTPATPDPTDAPAPTLAQPEDLGIAELPATGERPIWADLLSRWFGW